MLSLFANSKVIKSIKSDNFLNFKLSICLLVLFQLIPANLKALESTNQNGQPLELFGIAVHQELRNDIYIGAMFAPSGIKTVTQLFDSSVTKKMSLRFIQGYSNRKIARLWKQRIAMNNDKSQWQGLTKDIVRFSKLFKRSMQAGDEINLIYLPSKGTQIYLNGTMFLQLSNPEFYSLLLNIWFGNVPPSKLFKTGISGNNTDYLQQEIIKQYDSLTPELGRFDRDKPSSTSSRRVNNRKATTQNNSLAANTNTQSRVNANSNNVATQQLVDSFKPELTQTVTTKDRSTNSENKDTLFKLEIGGAEKAIEKTAIAPIDLSVEPLNNNLSNEQDQTSSESADSDLSHVNNTKNEPASHSAQNNPNIGSNEVIDNNLNSITKDESIENTSAINDAGSDGDLIRGGYTRELLDLVRKNQSYPKKAYQRGEEGDVIVELEIDRNGNIIDLKTIQRSGSRNLDRGVLRQIRRLEPFPPIPKALNLESFQIEIPVSFSLEK